MRTTQNIWPTDMSIEHRAVAIWYKNVYIYVLYMNVIIGDFYVWAFHIHSPAEALLRLRHEHDCMKLCI